MRAITPQWVRALSAHLRQFLVRARDRSLHVLLFQQAELTEATMGMFCLTMGIANAVWGSPWGTDAGDLWGGIALALFGVPQICAAIHGGIGFRHASNLLGCFAALANTVRAAAAVVPVAIVLYATVTALCSFLILRTDVCLGIEQARAERLGR